MPRVYRRLLLGRVALARGKGYIRAERDNPASPFTSAIKSVRTWRGKDVRRPLLKAVVADFDVRRRDRMGASQREDILNRSNVGEGSSALARGGVHNRPPAARGSSSASASATTDAIERVQ